MKQLSLDLHDIQGDVLEGLPKTTKTFFYIKLSIRRFQATL